MKSPRLLRLGLFYAINVTEESICLFPLLLREGVTNLKNLLDVATLDKARQDEVSMNDLLNSEDADKFIKYVIKTYTKSPAKFMLFNRIEFEDLMQLGRIGLYKGIKDAKLDRNIKEIQRYIYLRIQGEIREVARSNDSNQIVVSHRIRGMYPKYLKYHSSFYESNLRDPSMQEVMDEFSINHDDAYTLVYGMQATISDMVETTGGTVSVLETIQVRYFPSSMPVEQQVINKLVLEEKLCLLKDKERKAIELKYLLGYNYTEISKILGCANSMAHKYISTALKKMASTTAY